MPEVGKKYKLGDAEFTILAPSKKYEDANNNSISIILQYGDRRFLLQVMPKKRKSRIL